jgi:hypothetical protein
VFAFCSLKAARPPAMERQVSKRVDTLLVQVHLAAGLRGSHNDADPFVEVFFKDFADRDASVGETVVRKNTLQPSWEDHPPLELQVPARAQRGAGVPLVFHVLDYDRIGQNDILGEAQLPAEKWQRGCSRWELQLKQQRVEGSASRSDSDKLASGIVVVSCEWANGRTHATSAVGDNFRDDSAPAKVASAESNTEMPRHVDRSDRGDTHAGYSSGRGSSGIVSRDRGLRVQAADTPIPASQLPLGPCEIFVRVHEGRDFASGDQRSQTGDSLVKVTFNEQTHPTSTVSSTNNPVWNDRTSFQFEVRSQPPCVVQSPLFPHASDLSFSSRISGKF